MAKHKIAWLPGDGIGNDVMEATRLVLDKLHLDAEYIHGDIGWDFWCKEGDAFPERTIELLKRVDAAMFGAITSKPVRPQRPSSFKSSRAKVWSTAPRSCACGNHSTSTYACARARLTPGTP
jgi:isocitrate/isopropylmalate dehydrogenase